MAKVKFNGADIALKGEEVLVGSYAPEVTLVGQDLRSAAITASRY